jgi:putative selenoprotein
VSAHAAAALRRLWLLLRQWSGDSAYETYLARTEGTPLGRQAFYLDSLERRYRGPSRCC